MKPGEKKRNSPLQKKTVKRSDKVEVFQRLMNDSGITKLKSRPDPDQSASPPIRPNEPIEFREVSDWQPELGDISLNRKFSGLHKPARRKSKPKLKIAREFTPNEILDLHGETKDNAIARVHRLIRVSQHRDYQAILIITGKGINSKKKGGILGKAVWEWLQDYQQGRSIRFQWAPAFLGGKGAILVLF